MGLEELMDVIKVVSDEAINVAYCGGMSPEDYKIAKSAFPNGVLVAYQNHKKTYDAVANGACEVGILPFDKSYAGELGHVMDLFFEGDLVIEDVLNRDDGAETIRYAVISRKMNPLPADSKDPGFLLMFTVTDEAGSLAKAINTISGHGFNMSTLRSRKMKDLEWNYYFFVDAAGDCMSEEGQKMLEDLKGACQTLKVLGHYA